MDMDAWATLTNLNLIWNPVICSISTVLMGKHHCSYSITQCSGWYHRFNMYACIYKTNGVTSTCTQNKSHTTHLQIPSLISVCKNTCNQYNIINFIVHIYHINNINYINMIVRSKSCLTCPTLINTYGKWHLIILTNL